VQRAIATEILLPSTVELKIEGDNHLENSRIVNIFLAGLAQPDQVLLPEATIKRARCISRIKSEERTTAIVMHMQSRLLDYT
jgi:hypothetical protein